jgi:hypothetical protein
MNKVRIGVYSVKDKISNKENGYMRFRLKDYARVPMNVDAGYLYIRTPLSHHGYTTYTGALETSLDYYMTYIMDDLELTLIDIYEVYTL